MSQQLASPWHDAEGSKKDQTRQWIEKEQDQVDREHSTYETFAPKPQSKAELRMRSGYVIPCPPDLSFPVVLPFYLS